MESVEITFLGATETVTGSRFLLSYGGHHVLVDCGLYQGSKETEAKNWEPFAIDPHLIDAAVLTHAHLDHCGYLPVLTKMGFEGKIYSTFYTAKLAAVILHDSAYLQTEDARNAKKRGNSRHKNPMALYVDEDVNKCLEQFTTVDFHQRTEVAPGFHVTWHNSGHILGSAFVTVEVAGKHFLFTGDMGRPSHPILEKPDLPPPGNFDVVLTESTYGNRVHETPFNTFADEINAAIDRGGTLLIPAFAVDRTEVILVQLHELIKNGAIPQIPIYVDSPMALTSLKYYREALANKSHELSAEFIQKYAHEDPFNPGMLKELRTTEESKTLNQPHAASIVISASGMATGGRVVHHLAHMLPDPKNTVMLVGFQATGSRGHALEQGVKEIRIHGEFVPVRARIVKVENFSVHADSDELSLWLKNLQSPKKVFVVHGEPDSSSAFAARLQREFHWDASTASVGATYKLPT